MIFVFGQRLFISIIQSDINFTFFIQSNTAGCLHSKKNMICTLYMQILSQRWSSHVPQSHTITHVDIHEKKNSPENLDHVSLLGQGWSIFWMTCCCFVWFIDLWPQGQMRLWCLVDLNLRSRSCAECRTLAWRRLIGWLLLETGHCIERPGFLQQICKTQDIHQNSKHSQKEKERKEREERRERESEDTI